MVDVVVLIEECRQVMRVRVRLHLRTIVWTVIDCNFGKCSVYLFISNGDAVIQEECC